MTERLGETKEEEALRLRLVFRLLENTLSGATLEQTLDRLYETFDGVFPYDRIAFAQIDEARGLVTTRWARGASEPALRRGYALALSATSLPRVAAAKRPRIISDLEEYARKHPGSQSTRLILLEGMLSSLTCPLVIEDKTIGFLFFSSKSRAAYRDAHVGTFVLIAEILAGALEKTLLLERSADLQLRQERILSMVSHDLKVPLTVIQGYASHVGDSPDPLDGAAVRKAMSTIERACRQMSDLILNLLDLAGLQRGGLELHRQPTDMRAFLLERFGFHQVVAAQKNILLEKHLPEDLPTVAIDAARMRQALDNILSNAVKYSPPGSCVSLKASRTSRGVFVRVVDQGPGIEARERARLFAEFAQHHHGERSERGSVGLGLYIAERLLEAHGIRLRLGTRPGKGSVFGFTVPMAAA